MASRQFNLADLFEVVVDTVPDRLALVAGPVRLTYRQLDQRANRFAHYLEGQGIGLELTREAKELVASKGFDPALGARPLRRAIQSLIEDPVSEKILWKEIRVGETIIVDAEGDEIVFRKIEGLEPPPVELAGAGADS